MAEKNFFNDTVTMPREEYTALVDAMDFLMALQVAGVDNWEGYEVACRMANGELEEGDF